MALGSVSRMRVKRIMPMAVIAFGAVWLALALPGVAKGASCDPGEFCLYIHADANPADGLFEWSGNDGNLGNDYFENGNRNVFVSNNASAFQNRGYAGAYEDVLFYDGNWSTGASNCAPRGSFVGLAYNPWNDRISSYRWVNNC